MKDVFEGKLTLDHMATHVPHRFRVPDGVGTLKLKFEHSPQHPGVGDIAHQLSISVYGPAGARGTRHNNVDQSPVISTRWASPGYLPAPIEAGEWSVEIDVHRILPPGNVDYRIEVACEDQETEPPVAESIPAQVQQVKRRGPGWYTGDLHGHTFHSDGQFSPTEYLRLAHQRGYDFVSLTDHNTYSAVPELKELAGESITVIGGVELTTFHGHALALGLDGWTEWRVKDGSTMSGIAEALQNSGRLYVIAHPKSEGHPFCTGCRWAYSDMLPGPARHIEIWNREWATRSHNEGALHMFYAWLNQGLRMVATAGTDTHRPVPETYRIAANRVFAEDNTQEALLQALCLGKNYITCGPNLSLNAESTDGAAAEIGDVISSGRLRITCGWNAGEFRGGISQLHARLIRQGKEIDRWACATSVDAVVETLADPGSWFVLELRDESGGIYGLTNPVYVGSEHDDWN
ncbi:MAG: CehA/McbA family metallohydrolase [Pseudomonadales bacterium]